MESFEQREGQVLFRDDPAVIPQECIVNLLAFPKESGANYQGNYVLIKVPGLPRPFKDYWTLALL